MLFPGTDDVRNEPSTDAMVKITSMKRIVEIFHRIEGSVLISEVPFELINSFVSRDNEMRSDGDCIQYRG